MVPTLDFELSLIVNLLHFAFQHGGPREPYKAFSDTASDKERQPLLVRRPVWRRDSIRHNSNGGIIPGALCISKISKCLSAWELVFLHNSRRCSFFSRHSSHLWPRSSGRVLPSGSRTWLYAIKSACSTGLQENAQN